MIMLHKHSQGDLVQPWCMQQHKAVASKRHALWYNLILNYYFVFCIRGDLARLKYSIMYKTLVRTMAQAMIVKRNALMIESESKLFTLYFVSEDICICVLVWLCHKKYGKLWYSCPISMLTLSIFQLHADFIYFPILCLPYLFPRKQCRLLVASC